MCQLGRTIKIIILEPVPETEPQPAPVPPPLAVSDADKIGSGHPPK